MRISKWVLVCLSFWMLWCAKSPNEPGIDSKFRYSIAVGQMSLDSVRVGIEIPAWNHGDTIHLAMPAIYADNPLVLPSQPYLSTAMVMAADSSQVDYRLDSVQIGEYKSPSLHIPAKDFPLRVSYWVKFTGFARDEQAFSPPPFVGAEKGLLQGNYLFAVPYIDANMVGLWRTPFPSEVGFRIGEGVDFYGEPKIATYDTPYELLFSTSYLGCDLLTQGIGGGQEFMVLHFQPESVLTSGIIEDLKTNTAKILGKTCPSFGLVEDGFPIAVAIDGVRWMGGFEGTRAFSMYHPLPDDTLGVFNSVLAHEILHFWVGIRTGDQDDPWWKEGTAEYLGIQVACELGITQPSYAALVLLENLSTDAGVMGTALSDASVRRDLFSNDTLKNRIKLVYYKGAQVCMLLDQRIRVTSQGSATLFDAVAKTCRLFRGKAFTRSDYIAAIKDVSGADVTDLFNSYVDQTGAIPDSILKKSYDDLLSRGAFGASGSVAKGSYPRETTIFVGRH